MHLSSQRDKRQYLYFSTLIVTMGVVFLFGFCIYLDFSFIPFRPSGTSVKHSVLFAKNNSPNCFLNAQIIDSQCEWGIRIVLFAKNSPLDCFFNAQTVIKEIKVIYQLSMLTNFWCIFLSMF